MGNQRSLERGALDKTAETLIEEVCTGKWSHLMPPLNTRPVEQWTEVVSEISVRCPGHSTDEYVFALRRAQLFNR
jgi:hypothetical protein